MKNPIIFEEPDRCSIPKPNHNNGNFIIFEGPEEYCYKANEVEVYMKQKKMKVKIGGRR